MKKNILIYLFIFIGLYSCSDDNSNTSKFTIASKDIATDEYVKGGIYNILDVNNNVIETYTLSNGFLEIPNLPDNAYKIEEASSPKGYISRDKGNNTQYIDTKLMKAIFLYINENTRALPEHEKIRFISSEHNLYLGDYESVRIGEYYWTNRNMTGVIPAGYDYENNNPITQKLLDRYVERIRINTKQYQLDNISDFEKYYGRYYSYPSILYMKQHGVMKDEYNRTIDGWKLPAPEDYRQLFAMSPFNKTADGPHTSLNERDVRFALGAKEGDNPMAYNIQDPQNTAYKTYWFDSQHTTNMYKFNLMPGGARLNGPGQWCNGYGPIYGCYTDGVRGDIYHLFYTAYLAVEHPNDPLAVGAVMLHDRVDTKEIITYHFLNVRWCRRLTDTELGYKLYINADQTDIKKLDLEAAVPNGYKELPHGYIRGFYVQYILDKPNPTVTVKDIVAYAKNMQDNYVKENKGNTKIIL